MDEATPGPWGMIQSENGEFYLDEWYVSADGLDGMVAIVNGEANARRVAAAPDLLEALELLRDARIPEEYAEAIDKANAAIAKAQGLTE